MPRPWSVPEPRRAERPGGSRVRLVEAPAPASALEMRQAPVLGVPLALTTYAGAVDWIEDAVAAGRRGYICVANVHTVMAAQEDPELRAAILGSSFNVPDGQPLVWALAALGRRLPDRVYGPTLMERSCARAAATGTPVYLYGGRDEDGLRRLILALRRAHPGLRIVGGMSPPHRPLTDDEEEGIVRDINMSGASVVWVGIGVPKQEKWMARMRDRLDAPVLIGVGAAFDFHAGLVPQAPPRLQRAGLEWAFRLAQEPRRLWRRYLRYNPRFVLAFASEYARHRRGARA